MKKWSAFCFAFIGSLYCLTARAIDPETPAPQGREYFFFQDIPVAIASPAQPTNAASAPGIVSIITKEEIKNSGARNLDDILAFVPGFTPAMEISNIKGYGVRGLWSMEGKLLIMTDGIPMNDLSYDNPVFAGQFFTDNIERIEIIRGPGSAVYGDAAELAVINIITTKPDQKGGTISATYGQLPHTFGERVASFDYGNRWGDFGLSFSGTVGDGTLSDRHFADDFDQAISMKNTSGQKFYSANFYLEYKGLSLRFLADSLRQESSITGSLDSGTFTPAPPKPVIDSFTSYNVDLKYAWQALDRLVITPRLLYTWDSSWERAKDWAMEWDQNQNWFRFFPAERIKGSLAANYTLTDKIKLTLGGEYMHEYIWSKPSDDAIDIAGRDWWTFYTTNELKAGDYTESLFAEANAQTALADFTLGTRYDQNNQTGGALAPRFAATRDFGNFYLKLLASRAYRNPAMLTVHWWNPDLKPEFAMDYETELGYKLTSDSTVSINLFDTKITKAITYNGLYLNYGTTATWGLESQYRLRKDWGYLNFAYSFYRAYNNKIIETAAMDAGGQSVNGVNIALPTHKLTLQASIKTIGGLSINPGLIYMSQRYYEYDTIDLFNIPARLKPAFIANLYFREQIKNSGWEVGFGIFNLLNQKDAIPQGYYDSYRPVPSYGREYVIKTEYHF